MSTNGPKFLFDLMEVNVIFQCSYCGVTQLSTDKLEKLVIEKYVQCMYCEQSCLVEGMNISLRLRPEIK
jgi:transcription elongation factor Elf1